MERQINELRSALRAIVARIEGEWDHPDLVSCGPLSTDTTADVKGIALAVLGEDGY